MGTYGPFPARTGQYYRDQVVMLQSEITPSDATAKRHPALNDAGEIGDDSPCVSCGYNLRGLRMEGLCPECGTPIRKSLPPDMLRYAPEKWLRLVQIGAVVLWGSQLMSIEDYVIGLFYIAEGIDRQATSVWEAAGLLGLHVLGCYLLTVREKHSFETTQARRYRWIARAGMTAFALNAIRVKLTGGWMQDAARPISLIVEAGMLIAVVAVFLYLRCLLRRIPRPRWTRSIMFVIVAHCVERIASLSIIVPYLAIKLGGDSEQNFTNVARPLFRAYEIADFIAEIAWIPFALVYVWILARFMFYIERILKDRKKEKTRASLAQS